MVSFIRCDHGYWGAQMIEPYVDEEVSWAVRTHQALRFFPDEAAGYPYPEMYVKLFGDDYKPEPYIVAEYERARNHKWYMTVAADLHQRHLFVRSEHEGEPRRFRRHRRAQLPPARGRPRLRQLAVVAHVAHHDVAEPVPVKIVDDSPPVLTALDRPNSYIGRSVPRPNLTRLTEGRGQYVSDVTLPRMAHVAYLRSPHAHARIVDDRDGSGEESRRA